LGGSASVGVGERVLVTGAAGFIGSHLVEALLARGHEVVAADRVSVCDDVVAARNLSGALGRSRLRLRRVELAGDDLGPLVAGCGTVFHLAAVCGVRASWGTRFGEYVRSNIMATHRLLLACDAAGVRRLVFASSSSVYGASGGPSREDDPVCPMSPYGVTKLAAERLCLAYAGRPGAPLGVVALRYFTVYGPRQRPDMVIGRVLRAALGGVPVEVYGDGSQRREFTYVGDVVAATLAAASAGVPQAVVNVGGGSSVALAEVVGIAEEVTGCPVRVIRTGARAGDVHLTQADLTRARRLLGYRPSVGLREGMARQAAWLAEPGADRGTAVLPAGLGGSR
jgi:nucleoside-diphosphate-sugar epimerase